MKDPYLGKNDVLLNKLNITDSDMLAQAEADIGFLKLISIDSIKFDYFDNDLIKKIHKYIFEDIYEWAGEFRTTPLFKEEIVLPMISIPYSDPKNIEKDLNQKIIDLNSASWQNMSNAEISYNFARKLALLWRVHPFRDGNTRTFLSFAYLYAKEHGFPFDIETYTNELSREYDESGNISKCNIRDRFVLACLDDKDNPEVNYLAYIFSKAMDNYQNNLTHKK